jgi:predicted phage terminase large subunit-like protein
MATASAIDLSVYTPDEQDELLLLLDEAERNAALSDDERLFNEERSRLEADLSTFAKAAWPILEPGVELNWSWHYELFCEYLTLVYLRKLKRLIINLPPRTGKSIFVSVIFPAWVWAKQNTHNFACASYSADLAREHSIKRRALIESEWYQARWAEKVRMARDQNEKAKFKNTSMAQMIATSVGGTATGLGGDTLILDDGMNPKQVGSDAETLTAHNWFDNTWRTRLNDLATGAFIVMEQRTGERDITGHCLDADDQLEKAGKPREWTHLVIPLECDPVPVKYKYPISGKVKTREVGDVLQPDRFPNSVVSSLKIRRTTWATQYQQQPSPLEGNMIKVADLRYYGGRDPLTGEADPDLPAKFDLILVSADCSFKDEETSDFVAIGAIGVKGPNRYPLEITNAHLDLPATETEILRMQRVWRATVVLVEDKANGSAVIKSIRRKISGVIAIEPEGGKMVRMAAAAGSFQSNNWFFPRNSAWTETAIEQLTKFPAAKYDDVADLITQAEAYISRNTFVYGLTEYVKQEEAKLMAKVKNKKPLPANATAEEIRTHQDNPTNVAKIDTDDKTERCPECQGTFIQRVGSNKRCGACGFMLSLNKPAMPATTDFGNFRK